mgnify:CR=1 FL=1
MKRYAILKRVSTDEQSRPGHVSFDVQQKVCREFVVANGGVVIMEEADVDSAFQPARPGYLKVLDAARRSQIDAVVSYRYDRFGREPGEAITNVAALRKDPPGANYRVPGHGQLHARGEDAQATQRLRWVIRRQDEDRLREIQLPRDRLHPVRLEHRRIGKDGQRISTEGLIGKDVTMDEAQRWHELGSA